jgi:hypothetical protein
MKLNGIVILIILLLGLMLLSHLAPMLQEGLTNTGSTADAQYDYASDHYGNEEQPSNDAGSKDDTTVESDLIKTGTTLYGPNGEICQVLVNEKNKQYLEVRDSITKSPVYYNYDSTDVFKGPGGSIAEVFIGRDNQPRVSIADREGNTKVFAADGTQSDENTNNNSSNNNRSNHDSSNNGRSNNNRSNHDSSNHGSRMGTNNYETVYSSSNYSSSLPRGLPSSQIVPGTEDLYILKTQVVPPVCPACAATTGSYGKNKCPPCPACARCPESSFDCKKVPNYNTMDSQDSPFPVFNDFTSFGM